MKTTIRRFSLTLCLSTASLLAGCHSEPLHPEPQRVRLGTPVTLSPGETVSFTDAPLTLRFVRVLSDGRCPLDVACIWEGTAQFEVELRSGALATDSAIVAQLETQTRAREIVVGLYRVQTIDLTPYSQSTTIIPPHRYRVTLRVTRAE